MKASFLAGLTLVPIALAAVAALAEGDPTAGKQLFAAQMCGLCHTLAGESGQMAHVGGSLDGIAAKRDADWIERYLREPKSMIPESQMPASGLTDQQIEDLTAYLLSQ